MQLIDSFIHSDCKSAIQYDHNFGYLI